MEFKNVENTPYNVGNKIIFDKRSVAVAGVVFLSTIYSNPSPYVLVSKRGPKAADSVGLMNLVAGYLDWNERGEEAFIRETWEECGLNLLELMENGTVLKKDLDQPWFVQTSPSASQQNVTLRYGVHVFIDNENLPMLSTEHNEVEGEVLDPQWLPLDEIDMHKWAFNHDEVIRDYVSHCWIQDK